METQNPTLGFLESESAARYFADLDFALKQGRHIQNAGVTAKLWDYVNDHYEILYRYYEYLFGVFLRKESNERDTYFYLDLPEYGSGKFNNERHKDLDAKHVILSILLLNIYKERYFEKKEIKWPDLEQYIDEGESKELWQKLLYGEVKRNYTPNEKEEMRHKLERIVYDLEKLGWVEWQDRENFVFEIMPSIDRIARLYSDEITNVELMSEYIHEQLS